MIVADTCLIFHLFNQTFVTEMAQAVLEKDPNWIVPPLWKEEYANVLSLLTRKESRDFETVLIHFGHVVDEFKQLELYVDVLRAFEVSVKYEISVYDAHFVSLAIDHSISLVTEDREVLKKCPGIAVSITDFIKL